MARHVSFILFPLPKVLSVNFLSALHRRCIVYLCRGKQQSSNNCFYCRASLVPVFSFGENDLYDQVSNPAGSSLRQWQTKMKEYTRVAPVLFYGRGFGLLPHRRPIHTVCKLRNKIYWSILWCNSWEKESRISILISDTLVTLQQNACVNRGKRIRIPVSRKVLLVESAIFGFGIQNTAQEIRNPTKDWNPGSNFHLQRLESTAWNPEFKTVLNSLTRGETCQQYWR